MIETGFFYYKKIKEGFSYKTNLGMKAHIGGTDNAGYYVGNVFVKGRMWTISYHGNGVVGYIPDRLKLLLPNAFNELELCMARHSHNKVEYVAYNKAIKIAEGL